MPVFKISYSNILETVKVEHMLNPQYCGLLNPQNRFCKIAIASSYVTSIGKNIFFN